MGDRGRLLPKYIGLCPNADHMEASYFPTDKPEPERCPEPGCSEMLVKYATFAELNDRVRKAFDTGREDGEARTHVLSERA